MSLPLALRCGARPPVRLGQAAEADRGAHADRPARAPSQGEPLRHGDRAPGGGGRGRAPPRLTRALGRRHLQRPVEPAHGRGRRALRPQRPARAHVPRGRAGDPRAEPARGQPRAADAQGVHPRDDAQPARRRLAPVRGARLVQPRPRARLAVAGAARAATTRGAAADEIPRTRATRPRTTIRRRRRPTSRPTATGGTPRRSTAPTSSSRDALRSGQDGKLRLDEHGLLPADLEAHVDLSRRARATSGSGSALLHTLFMHEHNAICDAIRAEQPSWSDDELYDRARLVNAALMAKIHTVEWTPAIIAHPTTKLGMNANWWGLVGERFTKRFGRLGGSEVLSGIPGSATNHDGVPYSLTEEFVAVYRMHPLLPDEFTFRSVGDDSVLAGADVPRDRRAAHARAARGGRRRRTRSTPSASRIPGAITLHNYPRFLQRLERPDGDACSTSPRRTSCGSASAASRATTTSASCSTGPRRVVRGADRRAGEGGASSRRSTATSTGST